MQIHKHIAITLLSLAACNNYNVLEKLENPGSSEIFTANNYIFVSSWTTLGAMGGSPYADCNQYVGPARADCACTKAAISRSLRKSSSHVFRAWLSVDSSPGPQQDAICRVQGLGTGCATNFPAPWFNTQGQMVVSSYSGFGGTTIMNAIRYDEFGADQGSNPVWTGTSGGGIAFASFECEAWTDQGGGFSGKVGDRTEFSNTNLWTQNVNNVCNTSQRIYCVAAP